MRWPNWSEAVLAVVAVAAAVGIGFLAGGGARGASQAAQGQIRVTASGTSWVAPDEAQIDVGASETATTAQEAMQQMAKVSAAVLKAVAAYGIKPAQVQTSNLNLGQNYGPNGQPKGYMAQEQFTITTQDLKTLGQVIGAAAAAGANQMNSLEMLTSDPNAGRAQAVQSALRSAKRQAQSEAKELGVQLGAVRSVSVSASTPSPLPIAFQSVAKAAGTPATIATGNQEVQVSVDVTYAFH